MINCDVQIWNKVYLDYFFSLLNSKIDVTFLCINTEYQVVKYELVSVNRLEIAHFSFKQHNQCMWTNNELNSLENDYKACVFRRTHWMDYFFSVRPLSNLRDHSVFSSPPQRPMTSDFEGFLYQILSITLFSYLNSLVWRGPWLGSEPGTSRTRCQHSTTKLSRRREVVSFSEVKPKAVVRFSEVKLKTCVAASLFIYSLYSFTLTVLLYLEV